MRVYLLPFTSALVESAKRQARGSTKAGLRQGTEGKKNMHASAEALRDRLEVSKEVRDR